MTPRFSVIVPVHDARAYLDQCLRSVLDQDFTDLELLLVDDCSTDGSADVIAAISDPRARALHTRQSRGPGPARELAVDAARGRYLVFLDADDLLIPGALARLDQRIAELDQPDIVLYDHVRLDPDGTQRVNHERPTIARAAARGRFGLADQPDVLRLFNGAPTRSVRRDFLRASGVRFPEGSYEDIPWAIGTLLRSGSLGALDLALMRYRQRAAGSILRSTHSGHFDVFSQWDRTFADLGAHPEWEQFRGEVFAFMVAQLDTMLRNPVRVPGDVRGAFLREASACCRRHAPHGWHPEQVGRGGQRMRQAALVRGWTVPYRLLAAGKPLIDSAKRAAGRVIGPGASPESAGPA